MQVFEPRIAAMSSYLAFRYVAYPNAEFFESILPSSLDNEERGKIPVCNSSDMDIVIHNVLEQCNWKSTGLLLSGGMDSAILAAYAPKGTKAYTIRFIAENAIDESLMSTRYAEQYGLDLTVVDVYFEDYIDFAPKLMKNRRCPLHQIECAVYKAALRAKSDGLDALVLGKGADYLFGGLDKLLSRDWSFDDFIKRYTYVQPKDVLKIFHNIEDIYEPFRISGDGINVMNFLKNIYGAGNFLSFKNPLMAAGISLVEPYEHMALGISLDVARIRRGESKYLIRELFTKKYPQIPQPEKIPFKRPMDEWLSNYSNVARSEFKEDCLKTLSGDQKWLVFCLEWFLNLIDSGEIK